MPDFNIFKGLVNAIRGGEQTEAVSTEEIEQANNKVDEFIRKVDAGFIPPLRVPTEDNLHARAEFLQKQAQEAALLQLQKGLSEENKQRLTEVVTQITQQRAPLLKEIHGVSEGFQAEVEELNQNVRTFAAQVNLLDTTYPPGVGDTAEEKIEYLGTVEETLQQYQENDNVSENNQALLEIAQSTIDEAREALRDELDSSSTPSV